MARLKRLLSRDSDLVCYERECQRRRLAEADQRLHDQAERLHVVEWRERRLTTEEEEQRRRMADEHAVIMREREDEP